MAHTPYLTCAACGALSLLSDNNTLGSVRVAGDAVDHQRDTKTLACRNATMTVKSPLVLLRAAEMNEEFCEGEPKHDDLRRVDPAPPNASEAASFRQDETAPC